MWRAQTTLYLATAGLFALFAFFIAPAGTSHALVTSVGVYKGFTDPRPVTIHGYSGDAAEPFISPDGDYLLFNTGYGSTAPTVLEYATADGDGTFTYRGEISGANDPDTLNAVPSLADDGTMYFISNRSYQTTLATVYEGVFSRGSVAGVQLVPGIAAPRAGVVDFDASVSADDDSLYLSVGTYQGSSSVPTTAEIAVYQRGNEGFSLDVNSSKILAAVNKKNTLTYAADIASDGKELFYTQVALPSGQPSIFRATRSKVTQPFGHVQKVSAAAGFAEAPSVSADGRILYFHKVVSGLYQIYEATRA